MWVFLSNAFLSIVEHKDDPALLVVRARARTDLARVFPAHAGRVAHTPGGDYAFRASVPREEVAAALHAEVRRIGYTNFKDSVKEADRKAACLRVWNTMADFQEDRLRGKHGI